MRCSLFLFIFVFSPLHYYLLSYTYIAKTVCFALCKYLLSRKGIKHYLRSLILKFFCKGSSGIWPFVQSIPGYSTLYLDIVGNSLFQVRIEIYLENGKYVFKKQWVHFQIQQTSINLVQSNGQKHPIVHHHS